MLQKGCWEPYKACLGAACGSRKRGWEPLSYTAKVILYACGWFPYNWENSLYAPYISYLRRYWIRSIAAAMQDHKIYLRAFNVSCHDRHGGNAIRWSSSLPCAVGARHTCEMKPAPPSYALEFSLFIHRCHIASILAFTKVLQKTLICQLWNGPSASLLFKIKALRKMPPCTLINYWSMEVVSLTDIDWHITKNTIKEKKIKFKVAPVLS